MGTLVKIYSNSDAANPATAQHIAPDSLVFVQRKYVIITLVIFVIFKQLRKTIMLSVGTLL